MMRNYLVLLVLILAACNLFGQKREFLTPDWFRLPDPNKLVDSNDSLILNIDSNQYILTTTGLLKLNGQKVIQINPELLIGRAFLIRIENSLLLFCEETNHDISTSSVFKINLDDHSLDWSSEIPGGNLGLPIITDSIAYVSSAGSVGKINLNTGKYIWKHFYWLLDNKNYFFYYFDTILFQEDTIEFISKQRDRVDKVIVNDKTGQIIRIIK